LKKFIGKHVSSLEDAEDILQEVYYQLSLADLLMKPIDQINAWLYTVTRNRITDLYRKRKTISLPKFSSEDDDEDVFEDIQNLLLEDGKTPETEYLNKIIWEEINKVLDELPDEQRFVFEMTEFNNHSFKELAEITGEPMNTLISRKRYAILYLRERLKLIYDEFINF